MVNVDQAFTTYVEQSWSRLFGTAYALVGDVSRAEDLLQATLVKVYVNWRKVARADSPDAYVRKILVNQAANHWRVEKRQRDVVWAHSPSPTDVEHTAEVDERDAVLRIIRTLPPRQRAVVVLRYYEGFSEAEIARILAISPGTVKSQASSAMANLRAGITPQVRDFDEVQRGEK